MASDIEKLLNEKWGAGTIFRASSKASVKYDEELFLSSGSLNLNEDLSGNHKYGMMVGRIAEIFGAEQGGKTTMSLSFACEAGKRKIKTAFMDHEHSLDLKYAEKIGCDLDQMYVLQPQCAEDSFEQAYELLDKGVRLLIFDSVSAMVPRAELEGTMDDASMGLHARVMGRGVRKLTGLVSKHKAWCIFINQIRMKIGVFFGDPEVTTGGKALKFFTSYRLKVTSTRGDKIEENVSTGFIGKKETKEKQEVGGRMVVNIVKNKIAPPFRKTSLRINYGQGIDKVDDLVVFLSAKGAATMDGKNTSSSFNYEGKRYTLESFGEHLKDAKFREAVNKKIREVVK